MLPPAYFLFTDLAFSDYSENANTETAVSHALNRDFFISPPKITLPVEWGCREAPNVVSGVRNSTGIFAFGRFTMTTLGSRSTPFLISPAPTAPRPDDHHGSIPFS
jgi:hypothetical protein